MKKKDIRHYYKDKRRQLSASQINRLDDLLLIQFQKLPITIPAVIMTYAAIETQKEFNPQLITDYWYFKNPELQLIYPLLVNTNENTEMIAVLTHEETLFETNNVGIDEPVNGNEILSNEIEMIIVPLLGFDRKGYRVGYGKGYYHVFLKKCNNDCVKIGFSYFDPIDAIDDINSFDIPLDFCITHEKIYAF